MLSKQLLRSGTVVVALIREAEKAESKMDFIHKLAISQKECNETIFWLELLKKTDYLSTKEFASIPEKGNALLRMIQNAIFTTKQSIKKS